MDAYEAKNQELAAENADLRALLRSMQVHSIVLAAIQRFDLASCFQQLMPFGQSMERSFGKTF